ncbi:MAG: helix-turn-helix transcriptional regulator [Lachnospiraceae bacterium]|nr:helix-turn-helix transcriptional regulator [Lachnospiraceae bacterium]
MKDKSNYITTQELWGKLFTARSSEDYLRNYGSSLKMPAFSEYIKTLCEKRGERPETVIRRADLDSSYGHRLFSGERNPSRDTALRLAFALEQDFDGVQQLLKFARATALHPRVKRDAVIAYCLHNHKTLMDVQQMLYDHGMPVLGAGRNAV